MQGDWLGHALRRTGWQPQRQAVALATLGVFIAIIIGALYLAQAAATSTLGRQLEDMVAERTQLEQQNEQLRAEIARLQSVPRLRARAQELGFELASRDRIEYLLVEGYNPDRAVVIPVAPVEDAPVPVYDETLLGWLQQQLDSFTGQVDTFANRQEGS